MASKTKDLADELKIHILQTLAKKRVTLQIDAATNVSHHKVLCFVLKHGNHVSLKFHSHTTVF